MPLRRLLGVILLVAASSMGVVGPAVAKTHHDHHHHHHPYGPHNGDATVSRTRVVQGDSVRISGDGFCSNASVVLTVSQGGDTYITETIQANRHGVASTSVTLTELGPNHLQLAGCRSRGGTQVLSAQVQVVPHTASLHVSRHTVNKGDQVEVSGSGFCTSTPVSVQVYNDGQAYQSESITSDGGGQAETSITLTRPGRTTITFQGCRSGGGDVLESATVQVRHGHSFRSSPVAYAGDLAGGVPPAGYGVLGAGLLLVLFGAAQVIFVRRQRSR